MRPNPNCTFLIHNHFFIQQISYLAAFSCEISWILEAHGNLPTTSYLLCSGYFILFVASTILIHGLATVSINLLRYKYELQCVVTSLQGLPWGLFSWSVIIGALGIPELCLVMMITTQFWVRAHIIVNFLHIFITNGIAKLRRVYNRHTASLNSSATSFV